MGICMMCRSTDDWRIDKPVDGWVRWVGRWVDGRTVRWLAGWLMVVVALAGKGWLCLSEY